MPSFRSLLVCAAAIASTSLLLAGCGGGGSGVTTAAATAPPPPVSGGSSPTTPPVSATGRVTISWDAPTQNSDGTPLTNLSGYEIVYGQSATNLNQSVSVDDATATTYTISNLASGTWYFGVKATTTSSESDLSALASKTI